MRVGPPHWSPLAHRVYWELNSMGCGPYASQHLYPPARHRRRRERALWERGILDWGCFLAAAEDGRLRERIYQSAVPLVRQSLDAVAGGDAGFFHGRPAAPGDVAAVPGVRRPGPLPGHRDHRPVAALRPGDDDRRAGRRQAGPVRQAASTSTSSPPTSHSSRCWSRSTAASSTCRSCGRISPGPGWTRPTSTCGSCWLAGLPGRAEGRRKEVWASAATRRSKTWMASRPSGSGTATGVAIGRP